MNGYTYNIRIIIRKWVRNITYKCRAGSRSMVCSFLNLITLFPHHSFKCGFDEVIVEEAGRGEGEVSLACFCLSYPHHYDDKIALECSLARRVSTKFERI